MPRQVDLYRRFFISLILLFSVFNTAAQAGSAEIIQSPNDPRSYLAFELDNGLKVVVISDPNTDQATASLEVGVGSGDDPGHTQGLAHFLEHMLFLGTDKYPEAGAYQAYISQHGGSHNAFTAHDRTNYFFDIDKSKLEPALDRFSRFFIAPLFSPEYVDRERHAVHSEYQSKLKEDGRRQYAVLREVINPEHPLATFAVGSLDTLKDTEQATLVETLKQFYRQHYSADNMSLVVLGRESTAQLQQMVQQRFAEIPRHKLASRPDPVPLFKPGNLPAQLSIKSLKELRQLALTFPVPPIRDYYDRKPLNYLSALIGHEGEGSLLAELKRRGWANNLSAGPGFNYQDTASLSVNISLTPQGLEQYQEVVVLLFQQVERIRQQGIQQRRFDEEKQLSEIAFRFREPSKPVYEVLQLASKLREYPTSELLHGDYLYQQFDAKLIQAYLNYVRPDNMLLTLTAANLDTDQTDPYYQTQYRFQPLPATLQDQLAMVELNPLLTIPAANPFIPQDLSIHPAQGMQKPLALIEQPGFRLWYQQDDQFQVPRADLFFSFRSPLANDSPRHHLMTTLLTKLVDERLNAFLYPAYEAGLHTSIYSHVRGFSVKISGYSDRQQPLLEQIIDTLASIKIDADKLQIFKQELRRQLENKAKDKPYNQGFDALYQRILDPRWSTEQQLAAIDTIDARQLQAFKDELFMKGDVEALAHGNISQGQAKALATVLTQQLLASVEPVAVPPAQARELKAGTEEIELTIDHNDSSLILYLQAEQKDRAVRAQFGLLAKVIEAPFYTELRTEKQRGYIVFASPMPIQEHPALALVIQSPSSSPDTLLADIDSFFARGQALIEALDEPTLEAYRQGLISELMKQEQKLNQRSNRYWQEIDKGYVNFDSREQLANAIETVSKQQLLDTFNALNSRRLVVRSTGSGAGKG
ncbi:MAG: insulinase family protein [Halopseudomonas sp.]